MKKSRVKRLLRHEVLENRQLLAASGLGAGEPGDEFLLTDVNPTSTSFNQQVSPQAFDGQASVWYFTHST